MQSPASFGKPQGFADNSPGVSKLANVAVTEAHDREPSRLRNKWLRPSGVPDPTLDELLWHMFKENDFFLGGRVIDCCKTNGEALDLVKAFGNRADVASLFRSVIKEEVSACSEPQMIFRRNSGRSRVLAAYLKMAGRNALGMLLAPLIQAVDSLPPLEVDGNRQPGFSQEQLTGSARQLESLCQQLLDRLRESMEQFPTALLEMSKVVFDEVETHFPGSGQDAIITIFFLRFVCPAIVTPWIFGVTDKMIHPLHQRSLLLLSKLLQMTCVAAGGDETRRDQTIVRREESMGCFRNFIDEKRDYVQTMCRQLIQTEGVPTQLASSSQAALWTCPNSRCRSLLPCAELTCTRCDTAAPGENEEIVDGLSDRESSSIALAQFCKRHKTTLLKQIEAGCSSECEFTFDAKELLIGAAEDLSNAVTKGYSNDIVNDLAFELETEILGGPGQENPVALVAFLQDVIASKVEITVDAVLRVALHHDLGYEVGRLFLENYLDMILLQQDETGRSRRSSTLSVSNSETALAMSAIRMYSEEYVFQVSFSKLKWLVLNVMDHKLDGRTDFSNAAVINFDDPDTQLLDSFVAELIDQILVVEGDLVDMYSYLRMIYKHNELVEPGAGLASVKHFLYTYLSNSVYDIVCSVRTNAVTLAAITRRCLKFAFSDGSAPDGGLHSAGLGEAFKHACNNLEVRLVQGMSNMDLSTSVISENQQNPRLSLAGIPKLDPVRLAALLHLGGQSHRIKPARTTSRTDILPYSGKNHLILVLDSVIRKLEKTAMLM